MHFLPCIIKFTRIKDENQTDDQVNTSLRFDAITFSQSMLFTVYGDLNSSSIKDLIKNH